MLKDMERERANTGGKKPESGFYLVEAREGPPLGRFSQMSTGNMQLPGDLSI